MARLKGSKQIKPLKKWIKLSTQVSPEAWGVWQKLKADGVNLSEMFNKMILKLK